MTQYYVNRNAQANGDHEVHRQGCERMPERANCVPLGNHGDCRSAVAAAKRIYPQSNGCYYCSYECHTG